MSNAVNPVPQGFHTLTPHIVVNDSRKAADFYKRAFGAEILGMAEGPNGGIIHATAKIGDSMFMFNDEFPEWNTPSPTLTKADTCVRLNLYVENADKVFNDAVAAGAQVIMPLADQFWGDRYGQVLDPFGHRWAIAQHIQDLSPEQMQVAQEEAMSKMTSGE